MARNIYIVTIELDGLKEDEEQRAEGVAYVLHVLSNKIKTDLRLEHTELKLGGKNVGTAAPFVEGL